MNRGLKIPENGALDFLSLGALVHRLDPGIVPFRKAVECQIHVSGGEFNTAANLSDCFGLKTGVVSAMVNYPIGDLVAERVKATNCSVLLSLNWPTTVPSSLTPLTWLREYPEGAENVSKIQEAVWAACIRDECKRSATKAAGTRRGRLMKSSMGIFFAPQCAHFFVRILRIT